MNHLRRLPWEDEGRAAFVTPGDGIVNAVADAMEANMIETAREDARRALALADDQDASKAEMLVALRYVAHAVQDVALVADLRGERLPAADAPAGEVLWGAKARHIGQALREVGRRGDS
ncbi:hypothetical protein ACWD4J_34890 [Streptomyces sp. NPDC002577]